MLAPVPGEPRVVQSRQLVVEEPGLAAARSVEAPEDVEQRGLAAARRTEQHDELARLEQEVEAAQRVHFDVSGAVDLGQPPRTKGGSPVAHAAIMGRSRRILKSQWYGCRSFAEQLLDVDGGAGRERGQVVSAFQRRNDASRGMAIRDLAGSLA